MISTPETTAALVAGLREAADFLEAHPEAPIPIGVRMYAVVGVGRRQPDRYELVHEAARQMGVPVTSARGHGREAKREFGPVQLTVFAPADEEPEGTVVPRGHDAAEVAV